MSGPNHHEEMEAHYAAGTQRQEEQFLIDDAMAKAKAKVAQEVEREGYPPAAEMLVAIGVRAGVQASATALHEAETLIRSLQSEVTQAAGHGAREALAGLVRHIEKSSYRCSRSGLRLDGNISDFEAAEVALALPASAIEGGTEP
ncbi:hypothetical protein [Methylobacterium sp. WL19]|uniref:hypothetical protein n=1 Tax=Methylobacterium sp. WL19 TaxID=2603896 RepID=UPI0011CC6E46|nr:hypothetical protein [Methylobacterium sp. WL19]TXN22073.1 hypothetical protein FV220_22370 [Methylobacterium sp. WL19]